MVPYLVAELLIALNFEFITFKLYTNAIVGISALLITYIVYYCIQRLWACVFLISPIMLNQSIIQFCGNFKIILEQLSFATTNQELMQITSTFFKEAFKYQREK